MSIADRQGISRESFYKGVTRALKEQLLQEHFPILITDSSTQRKEDNNKFRLVDKGKRLLANLFVYLN